MTGAVLSTPVGDLGNETKVLTMGTMPSQLMEGLAVNGVKPQEISMDSGPAVAPAVAPAAPKEDFMSSFKSPTPGGMG